jgi:ABC-type transporter lipoprotein component MlaA/predicted alpha/beta-fold hydrolase
MKFLTTLFLLLVFTSFCCGDGTKIPIMRFVPGADIPSRPESHRYDYICSDDAFPAPEDIYCYFEDGKMHYLFQKRPEHINLFHEVGGKDPLEGMNRTLFTTSNFLLKWIFRPVAIAYTTVIPRPAIKVIDNICDHVEYPKRFLSCLLQGKFRDSGISTVRFAVNSTVGAVGAWDASNYFFNMKKREEDFGQAFGSWGISSGCYVFLPGVGPGNMRHAVGKIFDNSVDIKNFPYAYGAQTTAVSHRLLVNYEDYDRILKTSYDPYQVIKNFWYIRHKNQVDDHQLKIKHENYAKTEKKTSNSDLEYIKMDSYASQGAEIDTLKAMFFDVQKEKKSSFHYLSLFNTDFVNEGETYSIKVHNSKDKMEYHFWKQEANPTAPLILINPGLGAHHRSSTVLAIAENLHDKGFAVAAISNAFNWHFMETAASTPAPGLIPVDAQDARNAWAKVLEQIKDKDIRPKRVIMIGYSMGAIHSLYIAKLEELQNTLGVDRYLAINPPVDLMHGMKQLDNYYSTHKQWSKDKLVKNGSIALGKMITVSQKHYLVHDNDDPLIATTGQDTTQHPLNIEKDEAKFLIGYAFKMTLQEMLDSMHRRGKLPHIKTKYKWYNKTDTYDEFLKMNFQDYLKKVFMHHHRDRFGKNISEEEFMEKVAHHSHMKSFKNHFIENPDIRIVHTTNDFLVHDKSRNWLKETFKEKIVFFEHGGHLGNLYFSKVHDQIHDFLKKDKRVTPEQKKYHMETYASLAAPYNVPSNPPASSEFHNPR